MSSFGPQLPPSLSKRKRDDDDASLSDPSSPRPKQARSNADEIDVASSSDDDYGPSAVPGSAPKPAVAGPTLPTNTDEINIAGSDSDQSETGPAPPSSIGPTIPQSTAKQEEPESDSEDDYGPALPSSKPTIGPSLPPSASDSSTAPQPQQRDDWMLAPPSASGGYAERDPSKLRARKFASKPSAGGSKADGEISSIWTETPEEKLKRLQNSVLGRSSSGPEQQAGPAGATDKRNREEAERNRRIAENIERSKKGKSLVEEHQERRREKGHKLEDDDDDPSKRAFDREKDMAIGGRMGGKERRDMMTQAKGFTGRFQKGSYL